MSKQMSTHTLSMQHGYTPDACSDLQVAWLPSSERTMSADDKAEMDKMLEMASSISDVLLYHAFAVATVDFEKTKYAEIKKQHGGMFGSVAHTLLFDFSSNQSVCSTQTSLYLFAASN